MIPSIIMQLYAPYHWPELTYYLIWHDPTVVSWLIMFPLTRSNISIDFKISRVIIRCVSTWEQYLSFLPTTYICIVFTTTSAIMALQHYWRFWPRGLISKKWRNDNTGHQMPVVWESSSLNPPATLEDKNHMSGKPKEIESVTKVKQPRKRWDKEVLLCLKEHYHYQFNDKKVTIHTTHSTSLNFKKIWYNIEEEEGQEERRRRRSKWRSKKQKAKTKKHGGHRSRSVDFAVVCHPPTGT